MNGAQCGYLYDGKKGAWEDLPKSYSCPVCGAPKNRCAAVAVA